MVDMNYLADAIADKYGLCADTAVKKDGTFEVTRWDESIAGIKKPTKARLTSLVNDYIANVLPAKDLRAVRAERINSELSAADKDDLLLAWAVANPDQVPEHLKAKVIAAGT